MSNTEDSIEIEYRVRPSRYGEQWLRIEKRIPGIRFLFWKSSRWIGVKEFVQPTPEKIREAIVDMIELEIRRTIDERKAREIKQGSYRVSIKLGDESETSTYTIEETD